MPIEPNDLLLFARVVDEGSFSRASQRLEVPVSTVSRRITNLEACLGERLFRRSTRKLRVSEFGLAVLEHARQVVEGVESTAAVADNRHVEPSGRLGVRIVGDLELLGPFLAEFAATHASIVLELDPSPQLGDFVTDAFDVALCVGQVPPDTPLAARRIVELRGGLYASPAYLARRGVPSKPDDLLGHDSLHAARRGSERMQWLLQRGEMRWQGSPPGRIVADSAEVLHGMAIHGSGIVIAPHLAAKVHVECARLVRVLPEWEVPAVPLWALFPERRLMPTRTRVFVDALVAKLGPLERGAAQHRLPYDTRRATCAGAIALPVFAG